MPVTPDQISGLYSWHKADAITGLSNGAAVATWPDSSGALRNLTQGTAGNRPTYVTNSINGLPAVSFNGTASVLELASGFSAGSNNTFFIVFQPTSATTFAGLFDSAPGQANVYRNFNLGQWEWWNSSPVFNLTLLGTNPVLIALTATLAPSRRIIYERNNVQISNNTNASTTGIAWTTPRVGNINGGAPWYSGTIGEFIVYDRALNSTERTQVADYLREKWLLATRTIPATVRLDFAQSTRTVPASAALKATLTRAVPAMAALGGLGPTSALGIQASALTQYMRAGLRAGPNTRTVPISVNFVSLSVLRTTQAAVEALTSASPPLRTTQAAVEALTGSNPALRTTQAALEVLSRVILTLARSVPSSALISVRQSRTLPISAVLAFPAGYVPVRATLFGNTSSQGVRPSRPGFGLVLGASGGSGAVGLVRAVPAQVSLQYTTTQARVTQAAVEAVVQGNQARVTQAAIEAGVQGNQARVTQAALDVVLQAGNVRATQALLVALGQFGAVRVTQQPVFVLGQFGGVRVTQQSLVVLTLLRVNNVPATARFSVRGSRTIPLSARLSSGRAIPISAALRATRTRTVPVTAQLGVAVTTVSRAVPITARLAGPSITRTVPLVLKYWQQYTRTVPLAATLTQPRLVPISRSLGFTRVRPAVRLRLYTARQPTGFSRGVPLYMPTVLPVSKTVLLSIPAGLAALGQRGVSLQVRLALFGLARTVTLQLLDGGFYSSRGPRWIVATAALLQPSEHTVPLGLVAGDTRPGIHVTKYSLDVTMYQSVDEAQVVISQFVVEVIVPMGQLSSYGQIVG